MGRHRRSSRTQAYFAPPTPTGPIATHAKAPDRPAVSSGVRATISAGLMAASVAGIAAPIALANTGAVPAAATGTGKEAPASRPAAPSRAKSGVEDAPADRRVAREKENRGGHAHRRPGGKTQHPRREDRSHRGSDNVRHWIRKAIKIMQARGIPVLPEHIDEIRTIIEKESSGNPKAINLWDSNAKAGHPSKGLMQTIDSTFKAHKLPGHDDIYDPVDNIIAGVRYMFSRYGGFADHPGLKSMAAGGGYRGY